MELDELRADLAAFADEEEDVAVDGDGRFILVRGRQEVSGRLLDVDGVPSVRIGDEEFSYRRFLTHYLGRLDVLAQRLLRRAPVDAFIDGQVQLHRPAEDAVVGSALDLLAQECREAPPFAARVAFITADAGHGKTAVLREHQHRQAQAFLDGESGYLFWHVDLQGRQLLRLSEALMGDLGELRIAGLWMPAVLRLMRSRALVLAIDGFDELAAEQGGTDALGALATLVSQLGGTGVVIAAARRTFFDTDDYLRRAGVIGRAITSPCHFDQLSLLPWGADEGVAYLEKLEVADPAGTYADIAAELGDEDDHPMVTRPFLLTQVARALVTYGISPAEFIRSVDDPLSGVAAVVQAFVHREVQQKWVYAETGEPYLSVEQHMQVLADVAEEMYRSQRDRLDVDVIETITALLLDQWEIEPSRRHQVLEMVKMHVLLVPPADSNGQTRSFDHPEFRDYFIAYALRVHLDRVMDGGSARDLARYLSIAQLSDATARYVCGMLDRSEGRIQLLLRALEDMVEQEWKPTFLQVNVGTLVPFLCDGLFRDGVVFNARAIYSSLVLERSHLSNITIESGSFVNVSLLHANWENVTLRNCSLGEVMIGDDSHFTNVSLESCSIEGVRIAQADEEDIREFAPDRIVWRLESVGITCSEQQPELPLPVAIEDSPTGRLLHRVIRIFSRTTVISEKQLRHRFKQDQGTVLDVLIPLLEEHQIVGQRTWKGSGQTRIWALNERFDDLLHAEGGTGRPNLVAFWKAVQELS